MKLILFLLIPYVMSAQKMYVVNQQSYADIKVFVTSQRSQADLSVKEVKYESYAKKPGLWFLTSQPSYADKKIFFVHQPSQADLIIHYVNQESQVGWINSKKRFLLD